ncbi:hypothetical protein PspLS_02525 [Pyricularia sp. CBS 133598]|nr:hypothetical protein PspLS_02525 [Pyricularia sp. CBS 133598]
MRSSSIILLATAALAPFVAGTELKIDNKDVPFACTETCSDIQELSEMCYNKRDKNNSDKSEAACVCPNKEFDVASSAIACQKCFADQKASNDQRENIDRLVKTCNFSDKTPQQPRPSSPAGVMPTVPLAGPYPPGLASTCLPVTVTVTVTMGGNYTGPAKPTMAPPSSNKPNTPTPVRPPTTPTPIRPSGTMPAGNATRPGGPLPTAGASTVNPGFQLAALAGLVYLLA